ncbi:MAG: ATP-binding protein [Candidatus Omnitrophota bacterium]
MMMKGNRRITIRRKVLSIIGLLIFVGMGTGISLGYYAGYNLIQDITGQSRKQNAEMLAQSLSETISEKIRDIRTYLNNPEFMNSILESNLRYAAMDMDVIKNHLLDIDKRWRSGIEMALLTKENLDSISSASLEKLQEVEVTIGKIFLTDRYGGLVASSEETTDFYQADEEWWYDAFANGSGKFFVGDIEYDESSGVWGLPFAIPVRDSDMKLQGICKVVLDIDNFFISLENFRTGKTGNAALVDDNGYILFHKGVRPSSARFCEKDVYADIIKSKKAWHVINRLHGRDEKVFIVFADVEHPLLLDAGIRWRIFIEQDASEVFAPLKIYILQGVAVGFILVIILLPFSLFLSARFARPIIKLRKAAERISGGDLDYPIEIDSKDEIGELAYSFKEMILNIKTKQKEILDAKTKIEEWSSTLEKRIDERTKELTASQEATLNIMEDLQEAYDRLKEAQNQLIQAEKMEAIGRIASCIAHEVKNPLGVILQGTDYLEKKVPKEQGCADIINMIKNNIRRADDIISSLVDFSRASSLNIVPEDVNSILESSLILIQHRAKMDEIDIIRQMNKDLPRILAAKVRMEQVFINILLNAIQSMEKGGKLYIRTYTKKLQEISSKVGRREKGGDYFSLGEEAIIVEIEDTGCGMLPEALKKMFDPFFTTKEPGQGTGLGLSVTKNIIDMHKGIIDIKSEVGKGTKAIITLKISKGDDNGKKEDNGNR